MTFTVLALDRRAGLLGAATASYSLAVGASVIAVAPGAGAVLSQAYTNRALRRAVLESLRSGADAESAVGAALTSDDDPEYRQLAALDLRGHGGTHTGGACTPWAGAVAGTDLVLAGNLLTGPEVLDAMAEAYRAPRATGTAGAVGEHGLPPGIVASPVDEADLEAFAARLLGTMQAGERAGGDRRGRLSAALQVAPVAGAAGWPPDLAIDLRSDHAADPLSDLERILAVRFACPLSTAR